MDMKIKCLGCKKYEYEFWISEYEISQTKVISLVCPDCGKSTAIQQRDAGGLEIALDKVISDQ